MQSFFRSYWFTDILFGVTDFWSGVTTVLCSSIVNMLEPILRSHEVSFRCCSQVALSKMQHQAWRLPSLLRFQYWKHTISINYNQAANTSFWCKIRHIHHVPGALQEAAEAMRCQRQLPDCSHLLAQPYKKLAPNTVNLLQVYWTRAPHSGTQNKVHSESSALSKL